MVQPNRVDSIMALWRWERGRQDGGYEKFLIARSNLFKFDVYLLRFRDGQSIPFHVDPSPIGFEHHRVNITLCMPCAGGTVLIEKSPNTNKFLVSEGRIVHFRPDKLRHAMTKVISGQRIFLSIGWLRKIK